MADPLPTVASDAGPREVVPVMVFGPDGQYAGSRQPDALGYRIYPLSTSQVFKVPAPPSGAREALLKIEGAPARYRDDGIDPTTTEGLPLLVGESLRYDAVMRDMRLIGQQDGSVCHIAYYGVR